MRGLPFFFFRLTADAPPISLLRQNAQIKGILCSGIIRAPPLIPRLRLVILCAEPQLTEFQQQEPFEGLRKRTQQAQLKIQTDNVDHRRRKDGIKIVPLSMHRQPKEGSA